MTRLRIRPSQEQQRVPGGRRPSLPKSWTALSSDEWWDTLAVAPRSILMLDYDGTLAPFITQRMHAMPYPGVSERLIQMVRQSRVRLILLSGRSAKELAGLLPALEVEIWGSNGRERLLPNANYGVATLSRYQNGALAWLESTLKENGFSALIEKKPGSLALHTRGRQPEFEQHLIKLIPSLFRQLSDQTALEWLPFDGGFEVRASGCSNAEVVNCVLNEEPSEAVVAYLGDDIADEEAFRVLKGRGLRVHVRDEPRETLADVWLRPPEELLSFLDRWIAATS
jgi:trehalose-phosphatase